MVGRIARHGPSRQWAWRPQRSKHGPQLRDGGTGLAEDALRQREEQVPTAPRARLGDMHAAGVAAWSSGSLPIHEPGLAEIVKERHGKNLSFSTDRSKDTANTGRPTAPCVGLAQKGSRPTDETPGPGASQGADHHAVSSGKGVEPLPHRGSWGADPPCSPSACQPESGALRCARRRERGGSRPSLWLGC